MIKCFRCNGEGVLPQFSHIRGGVCFTCGGTGKAKTFSVNSLNRKSGKESIRSYIVHSSNRDLANIFKSGEFTKLKDEQLAEARKELIRRASQYYGLKESDYGSAKELAGKMLKELDKIEKEMKKPYEDGWYYQNGKVDLVPVHWLKKFQGNNLRRDEKGMKDFSRQLAAEGLKEPVVISVGREDRNVSVGEGNHRLNAFIEAGLDYIPARVNVSAKHTWGETKYYDRMSRVPVKDYYKADARPTEVFDTFYDHGSLTKMDEAAMNRMGYKKLNFQNEDGISYNGVKVKGIFVDDYSSSANKLLKEILDEYFEEGSAKEALSTALEKYAELKSEDGFVTITMAELIEGVEDVISDRDKGSGFVISDELNDELDRMLMDL